MWILAVLFTARVFAAEPLFEVEAALAPADWVPSPPADLPIVAAKLREHCRSCHALGSQRFIYDESDQALWVRLYSLSAPVSGELWAERIARVLDWPTDSAPPFGEFMEPPDRDWMPKGAGRMLIATDTHEGQLVRRLIVNRLREGLKQ
jgi:hypothetical protein